MVLLVSLLGGTGLALTVLAGVGGHLGGFGGSPVVAAALAVGAAVTASLARRASSPVTARWLWAGAGSVVAYQLLLVAADTLDSAVLVGLALVGHVPTLSLAALAPLAVRRALTGEASPAVGRAITALAVGATALLLVSASGVGGAALRTAAGTVNLLWLGSLAVPVVVVLRAHRRCSDTPLRERLGVAAAGAAAPVAQVLVCGLLGVAASASGLGEDAAAVVLVSGVGVMWPLAATALALATRGQGDAAYTVGPGVLTRAVLLTLSSVAVLLGATVGVVLALRWPALGTLGAALLAAAAALAVQPWLRRVGDGVAGRAPAPSSGAIGSADPEADGSLAPVRDLRPREPRPADVLTAREGEVLGLLAAGLSNAGIAAELVLSERTVEAHLRAVFTKLRLPDDRSDNRRVLAALAWHELHRHPTTDRRREA